MCRLSGTPSHTPRYCPASLSVAPSCRQSPEVRNLPYLSSPFTLLVFSPSFPFQIFWIPKLIMAFNVEEVLSKLTNAEKSALLSGRIPNCKKSHCLKTHHVLSQNPSIRGVNRVVEAVFVYASSTIPVPRPPVTNFQLRLI